MRFLVDECAGPKVAKWLLDDGHAVFSIFDSARGTSDDEILNKAFNENWILITTDKDFGEMVFRERRQHRGVVFLRLVDERAVNKIVVLQELLKNHAERLPERFVTVTESRVRFT